jgi:hypothetical protein
VTIFFVLDDKEEYLAVTEDILTALDVMRLGPHRRVEREDGVLMAKMRTSAYSYKEEPFVLSDDRPANPLYVFGRGPVRNHVRSQKSIRSA